MFKQASIRSNKIDKTYELHKDSVEKSIEGVFTTYEDSLTVEVI